MLLDEAFLFAEEAHRRQTRKGAETPYIVHPFGVAMLLGRAGCDDELVAAGLLHDVVEDCGVTLEQLSARFGARVAAVVEGCSEPDRGASWEERKRHTIEYLRTAPLEVKLVSCADKLHNVRSMQADEERLGAALWSRFKRGKAEQGWYYRGLVQAFRAEIEAGLYPGLFAELERAVRTLFG
jgi:(p)ppGpp synthase/HD superfamily hydrolase